ncbi:MAG TPA: hypothetical protein VNX21_00480 [Candidatus Thermoplasmatota archaeon]|nr:hypothetical protein [Candidatus Thermoplasmatota archaeon]
MPRLAFPLLLLVGLALAPAASATLHVRDVPVCVQRQPPPTYVQASAGSACGPASVSIQTDGKTTVITVCVESLAGGSLCHVYTLDCGDLPLRSVGCWQLNRQGPDLGLLS